MQLEMFVSQLRAPPKNIKVRALNPEGAPFSRSKGK